MPETLPFGATTLLMALLVLFPRKPPAGAGAARRWAVATGLAMSMTITNLLVVAVAAAIVAPRALGGGARSIRAGPTPIVPGGAAGPAGLAVLVVPQDRLFGDVGLFSIPTALVAERQFVGGDDAPSGVARQQTLLAQSQVVGTVAGPPEVALAGSGVSDDGLVVDGRQPADAMGLAATAS